MDITNVERLDALTKGTWVEPDGTAWSLRAIRPDLLDNVLGQMARKLDVAIPLIQQMAQELMERQAQATEKV